MKKVEFRFLQFVPAHISGERLTLALLHWDGERLRIAWSLDPLSFCEADQRDILRRTVVAKLVRAAKQASHALGTEGIGLKDVVPVREGLGASLYWSPIQEVSLTSSPQAHFEEIRHTLRIRNDVTPIAGEYERLLVTSHRAGGVDGSVGRLQELQPLLSDRERRLFDALARDLGSRESSNPVGAANEERRFLAKRMRDAWSRQDWETVLDCLRSAPALVPAEQQAYARARCWGELGFRQAYVAFLDRAAETAPGNPRYPALAIQGLAEAGRIEDALDRAEKVLDKDIMPPVIQIQAAHALFRSTDALDDSRARPVLDRVVAVMRRILDKSANLHAEPGLRASVVGAYVELGMCYERLGDPKRAREAYDEAIDVDPGNDAALVARGLLTSVADPPAAASDFQKAAGASTTLPWPYVFLAHWFVSRGEYTECIAICEKAETLLGHRPRMLANLLEWKAIALAHAGAPRDEVRSLFQDALSQEPLNDRIRENLERFETWVAQGGGEEKEALPEFCVALDTPPEDARGKMLRSAA